MPIIETRELRKVFRSLVRRPGVAGTLRTLFSREYEDKVAVEGVTMALDEGELVGYIGPNGAGKSTTIKMLTGILVPTSGRDPRRGHRPARAAQANARNIGVVFGQRSQLYWDLPLRRIVRAAARDLRRCRANATARTSTTSPTCSRWAPFLRTPVRQLSLGQRMRGDFAAAMLHDPKIVYLDEPTIGLDVVAKEAIREFVARVNRERGTTIILTTHDLGRRRAAVPADRADRQGTLVYDGEIERCATTTARTARSS